MATGALIAVFVVFVTIFPLTTTAFAGSCIAVTVAAVATFTLVRGTLAARLTFLLTTLPVVLTPALATAIDVRHPESRIQNTLNTKKENRL